ncbi:MAG: anti-sigma factor domain-containing protein [Oscillospiraceae bacterium]|nr:anti-sigma factor domain-containing protein [Oscillospiraceae bacterium]
MKAVIVEIRGNRAAALLENGRFVSIPDSSYSVGQEITLLQRESGRKQRSSFRQRVAAIAASAVLILGAGGGGLAYAMPYGTVSMDVNPSIEYTINRFDRVLQVSGVNEDGQAVIEAIGKSRLLNKKIDDAVTATIFQLEEDGYLTGDEDAIVFSSGTGSEAHSVSLAASLEEQFSPRAEIYSVAVSREEIASAHEKGTTAGKMNLVGRLAQESPEVFSEPDWIDRPVNELMHAFHQEADPAAPSKPGDISSLPDSQGHTAPQKEPAPALHDETIPDSSFPAGGQTEHVPQQPQTENRPESVPDRSPDHSPDREPSGKNEGYRSEVPPAAERNMSPGNESQNMKDGNSPMKAQAGK